MPVYDHILIDGNYYARRMYSVHKHLSVNKNGQTIYTGALHGFLNQLLKIKLDYEGQVWIIFDSGIERRKAIDASYKEKRRTLERDAKKIEDQKRFFEHFKFLKWFLKKYIPVPVAWKTGEEGDDVLHTLSRKLTGKILIASNDHDMYQSISDNVHLLTSGKDRNIVYDSGRFEAKFGITPEQYTWVMTLTGCRGDGVPGFRGIGNKIAIETVQKYPGLVPVLAGFNPDRLITEWLPKVDGKGKVIEKNNHFEIGDKPGKRFLSLFECDRLAMKTYDLIRLYDVWPVMIRPRPKPPEDLEEVFETYQMFDLASKADRLLEL